MLACKIILGGCLTTIFDKIIGSIHLRFRDRETAGNILGEALKELIKKEDRENILHSVLKILFK